MASRFETLREGQCWFNPWLLNHYVRYGENCVFDSANNKKCKLFRKKVNYASCLELSQFVNTSPLHHCSLRGFANPSVIPAICSTVCKSRRINSVRHRAPLCPEGKQSLVTPCHGTFPFASYLEAFFYCVTPLLHDLPLKKGEESLHILEWHLKPSLVFEGN